MSTVTERAIKVGDTVHITEGRWAGTYTVAKRNPTTYALVRVPDGARLRAAHEYVQAGPLPVTTRVTPEALPTAEYFQPGTVVTFSARPGLWVVTGSTPKGSRIFPLGGSDRYFTNVAATRLTRVTSIEGWTA